MKDEIIIKRYAEAYIAFAEPVIGMPQIVSDMKKLRGYMRECPDLITVLHAPEIPPSEKGKFLQKVLSGSLQNETILFITYLVSRHREECLVGITDYVRVVYSHGQVVDVVLRSTYPLELEDIERIKKSLSKRMGKNVNVYFQLDPDLLGGMQIVIGNRIIDGSVRNKLNELKRKLLKVQVSK
jgi:F-type H+-transporting ATPase subunit delta